MASTLQKGATMANGIMVRCSILAMSLLGCGGAVESPATDAGVDAVSDTVTSTDAATSSVCGGKAGIACPEGMFCKFADGTCHNPDEAGTCQQKVVLPCPPPQPGDEVCACDGNTYQSACEATSAYQSILHAGACHGIPTPARTCGGIAGSECAADEYCDWGALPNYCGGDDGTGVCKKRPTSCIPSDGIYCGCDGKTYESPCAAALAGQGVRKNGPC